MRYLRHRKITCPRLYKEMVWNWVFWLNLIHSSWNNNLHPRCLGAGSEIQAEYLCLHEGIMSGDKKRRVFHSHNLIFPPCFGKWQQHQSSCLRQKIDFNQDISLLIISHNNHPQSCILSTSLVSQKICPTHFPVLTMWAFMIFSLV